MRIINIIESPVLTKRYRVYLDNGEKYDFGLDKGQTYIDHHDEQLRRNYWLRHMGNPIEYELVSNLKLSPSLFSSMLLWGKSTSLRENINELNRLFKEKYGR